MLDESEFASVQEIYQARAHEVKLARTSEGRSLTASDSAAIASSVAARYFELTGASGLDTQEILRHGLSRFGPPCPNCGKELRTPRARKCLECCSNNVG